MKTQFSKKQLWCIVLCVLFSLNVLTFTQIQKSEYETAAVHALTMQYKEDILQMEDAGRKTLTTHLLTMDAFVEDASAIFAEQAFPEGVTAMLAYDGDNMGKKVESHGEEAVNMLMVAFADVTKKHFPESSTNIVCNVGEKSDEFYVLLMGRSSREALLAEVEAFQQDIRTIRIQTADGRELSGSVSIGVAFYQDGDTFEGLFEEADTAGYAAKAAGKDCYRIAKEQEDTYANG